MVCLFVILLQGSINRFNKSNKEFKLRILVNQSAFKVFDYSLTDEILESDV